MPAVRWVGGVELEIREHGLAHALQAHAPGLDAALGRVKAQFRAVVLEVDQVARVDVGVGVRDERDGEYEREVAKWHQG